jgi:CheY-like chemotaxis protein
MTSPNQLHILIAEDDIDDAETIFHSFDIHPLFYKVDIVANGKELLDFLETLDGKPDVILTDINMPIINGIEALVKINENDMLREIPAFVYSTAINPIYAAQCEALGTKGFLIKPFSLSEFNEIPGKILEILRSK